MPGIDKIICPLDLSSHSVTVARFAGKLAKQLDSSVLVLYVAPEFTEFVNFYVSPVPIHKPINPEKKGEAGTEPQGHHDNLIEEAQAVINKLIAENLQEVEASSLIVKGAIAEEILKASKDNNIDMIIMGTQGRTGLERILLGSVAEQIIKTAPVPVVTIRPQDQGRE